MPTIHRPKPLPESLKEIEALNAPINCRATDYPAGWYIAPHAHNKHQLIYAVRGVMVVKTEGGQWVVPPTRAIWVLSGVLHEIRCVGEVHMRSLLVRPDAGPKLLDATQAVGISPLLRALPVLPLHLHMPSDARLAQICEHLQRRLDDSSTMADWAERLGVDVKTIQRLFTKETGMTFGQWRQQARLLHALELLATGQKVIDVALALGYESPSAFATMFRKQFGQTPSQFFQEL